LLLKYWFRQILILINYMKLMKARRSFIYVKCIKHNTVPIYFDYTSQTIQKAERQTLRELTTTYLLTNKEKLKYFWYVRKFRVEKYNDVSSNLMNYTPKLNWYTETIITPMWNIKIKIYYQLYTIKTTQCLIYFNNTYRHLNSKKLKLMKYILL
jgi:hypothetical protein